MYRFCALPVTITWPNRPQDPAEFAAGNVDLTRALCKAVCAMAEATGKKTPIVAVISVQVLNEITAVCLRSPVWHAGATD